MKRKDVDVVSPLRYNKATMRDTKHLEKHSNKLAESKKEKSLFRNLLNSEDRKEKRKSFLRSLIKSVDTGANGTLDYIVKKGSGKNKIAKTRQ